MCSLDNKPDDSKGKLLYYFETSENSAAKEVSAARPPPDEILAKGVENLFKATGNGKKKKKKKGVPEERPSHGFKHDDLVWVLMVHGNWWPAVIRDLNQARKVSRMLQFAKEDVRDGVTPPPYLPIPP